MDRAVLEQAAYWQLQLEEASAEEMARIQAECRCWRAADARHEAAWQAICQTQKALSTIPARPVYGLLSDARISRKTLLKIPMAQLVRLHKYKISAWALVVATVLMVAFRSDLMMRQSADYATEVGETKSIVLADGSIVTLGSDSAIDVVYSQEMRRIRLLDGQILLQVAPNPQRPFVVQTPHSRATALGTVYQVGYDRHSQQGAVDVLESRVRVCDQRRHCAVLQADQSVQISPRGQISAIYPQDNQASSAWRKGQIWADNVPLNQVLAQLSRYYSGHLSYDAAALRAYRVSGVFSVHETQQTLHYLSRVAPIEIDARIPFWIRVRVASK